MHDKVLTKLGILADAAKYDASCASSGGQKRNSLKSGGIGSTEGMGICHAYAPDGRCISLLKILLTNYCVYDCAYCINRKSSNVRRARFTVKEVIDLTLGFYKRNYIEGLFLSSGIIKNSDYTMEELVRVAKSLRLDHGFKGYIHLKTIPDADPDLIDAAGMYADRISINIELPQDASLKAYAPEKDGRGIRRTMGRVRLNIEAHRQDKIAAKHDKRFAPAGQSTQMIVGADASRDSDILTTSASLYSGYRLNRVYYSAFSPIPDASKALPLRAAPLQREHRLYQADWMLRFYGFELHEIVGSTAAGMLDLEIDPKLAWALQNRGQFPVDLNTAPYDQVLRVPGIGPLAAKRIVQSRRWRRLRIEDMPRLTRSLKTARSFITVDGWHPGSSLDGLDLRAVVAPKRQQLDLFSEAA